MKLPKKGRISHVMCRINPMTELEAERRDGTFDYPNSEIKIDCLMDIQVVKESLLHEAMHGIWFHYGIKDTDDEEDTIKKMSAGLTQVFLDNPKIGKFLMG